MGKRLKLGEIVVARGNEWFAVHACCKKLRRLCFTIA